MTRRRAKLSRLSIYNRGGGHDKTTPREGPKEETNLFMVVIGKLRSLATTFSCRFALDANGRLIVHCAVMPDWFIIWKLDQLDVFNLWRSFLIARRTGSAWRHFALFLVRNGICCCRRKVIVRLWWIWEGGECNNNSGNELLKWSLNG